MANPLSLVLAVNRTADYVEPPSVKIYGVVLGNVRKHYSLLIFQEILREKINVPLSGSRRNKLKRATFFKLRTVLGTKPSKY